MSSYPPSSSPHTGGVRFPLTTSLTTTHAGVRLVHPPPLPPQLADNSSSGRFQPPPSHAQQQQQHSVASNFRAPPPPPPPYHQEPFIPSSAPSRTPHNSSRRHSSMPADPPSHPATTTRAARVPFRRETSPPQQQKRNWDDDDVGRQVGGVGVTTATAPTLLYDEIVSECCPRGLPPGFIFRFHDGRLMLMDHTARQVHYHLEELRALPEFLTRKWAEMQRCYLEVATLQKGTRRDVEVSATRNRHRGSATTGSRLPPPPPYPATLQRRATTHHDLPTRERRRGGRGSSVGSDEVSSPRRCGTKTNRRRRTSNNKRYRSPSSSSSSSPSSSSSSSSSGVSRRRRRRHRNKQHRTEHTRSSGRSSRRRRRDLSYSSTSSSSSSSSSSRSRSSSSERGSQSARRLEGKEREKKKDDALLNHGDGKINRQCTEEDKDQQQSMREFKQSGAYAHHKREYWQRVELGEEEETPGKWSPLLPSEKQHPCLQDGKQRCSFQQRNQVCPYATLPFLACLTYLKNGECPEGKRCRFEHMNAAGEYDHHHNRHSNQSPPPPDEEETSIHKKDAEGRDDRRQAKLTATASGDSELARAIRSQMRIVRHGSRTELDAKSPLHNGNGGVDTHEATTGRPTKNKQKGEVSSSTFITEQEGDKKHVPLIVVDVEEEEASTANASREVGEKAREGHRSLAGDPPPPPLQTEEFVEDLSMNDQ